MKFQTSYIQLCATEKKNMSQQQNVKIPNLKGEMKRKTFLINLVKYSSTAALVLHHHRLSHRAQGVFFKEIAILGDCNHLGEGSYPSFYKLIK